MNLTIPPIILNQNDMKHYKLFKEGDKVDVNTPLLVVEAMKIETTIVSKTAGVVEKVYVSEGEKVNSEDLLVTFKL